MLLKTMDSNQNESKGVDDWELAALGRKIMIGQLSTRIELMDLTIVFGKVGGGCVSRTESEYRSPF